MRHKRMLEFYHRGVKAITHPGWHTGVAYLYYHTKEKNKKELIKKIKASFSKMHNKSEADIESAILQPGKKSLIIMVSQ